MTKRRLFIGLLVAGVAMNSVTTRGQPSTKLSHIGVLALADIPYANDALRQGLREQGYVDGQNIEIEYRSGGGDVNRLPALAKELIARNVELIVVMGSGAARAAKQVTNSIPIVMAPVGNPVEGGFVTSLSRPGGNMTGVSVVSLDLAGKRLALAKELLPNATRMQSEQRRTASPTQNSALPVNDPLPLNACGNTTPLKHRVVQM